MKKYLITLLALSTVFCGCKFDDDEIVYGETTIYFTNQAWNRNIVVGEGLKMDVGVNLTGLLQNDKDRTATCIVKPSMVTAAGKTILPTNYYTIPEPFKITIKKGQLLGFATVKIDSALFVNDPKALTGEYVLPLKIVAVEGVDRINEKDSIQISVSYYAKQFGNYYYNGSRVKTGDASSKVNYKNDATATASVRQLTTINANTMKVVADPQGTNDPAKGDGGDPVKGAYSFYLRVPTAGGGDVTILPNPTSPIVVTPNGECKYDSKTRVFTLNYKYTDEDGVEWQASETMTFRNRIRDVNGATYINEWRGIPE